MWRWGLSPADPRPADTAAFVPTGAAPSYPLGHPHLPFWIPAFAGMTRRVAGVYFRDRPFQVMKLRIAFYSPSPQSSPQGRGTFPAWIPASGYRHAFPDRWPPEISWHAPVGRRMKMGRRVSFFHRLVVLPLPTPSGFRPSRNDEWQGYGAYENEPWRCLGAIAGMTNGGPD